MWRASTRNLLGLIGAAAVLAAPAPLAAQAGSGAAATTADSAAMANAIRAQPGDSVGRLDYPQVAGRAARPVTAADNSALVKSIEEKIRCTCGCNLSVYTCRTTDFECTVSPAMHREVLARLAAGMTETEVLASFQKQYGEMIFMTPPKHGFNLLAYIMPFLGLAVGVGLVSAVVRRWFHAGPADAAPVEERAEAAQVSPDDMERLKRALEQYED
jgi:cytochrome c-type biogenesis protein CcmH